METPKEIIIERCYWKKTRLHIVAINKACFLPDDRVLLLQNDGSVFAAFGCVFVNDSELTLRPLIGQEGAPLAPGFYAITVLRDNETIFLVPSESSLDDDAILDFCGGGDCFRVVLSTGNYGLSLEVQMKRAKKMLDLRNALSGLYTGFWVGVFNILRSITKVDEHKIAFVSDSRVELGGNMEPLFRRMQERGLDVKNKIVTSFIQESGKKRRTPLKKLELAAALATSRVIFCDDFLPYLYQVKLRSGQRLVQLWHACGHFKTVGFSKVGAHDCMSPFSNNHKTYTDVIVASEEDVPYYAEAFGVLESAVHPLGIPRHDWLLDPRWQDAKKSSFVEMFPGARGKRVVIFAPTFRGKGKRAAHYDYNQWDFERLAEFCRENALFFVFKMHPFILEKPLLPQRSDDVFADATAVREINDLLPSVDVLITDYSSVIYEASLLNISTVFFVYDLEEYIRSRDFYEPFDAYACGPVVRSFDELLEVLSRGDLQVEKLAAFKRKNFKHLDGKSCDRIIDEFLA